MICPQTRLLFSGLPLSRNDYIKRFTSPCRRLHEAPEGFVAKERLDFKSAKRMELFSQYAVAAAKEALEHARIEMEHDRWSEFPWRRP